jgi:hypothetical protein
MDAHAEGTKQRHGHHIIPRAFGGSSGPVVDICNEDHDLLHRLAVRVIHGLMDLDDVASSCYSDEHYAAIRYLVGCVVNAEAATRNDPNKRTLVSVSLSGKQSRMLDDLTKIFNVGSRAATLIRLIESEHRRLIPQLPQPSSTAKRPPH